MTQASVVDLEAIKELAAQLRDIYRPFFSADREGAADAIDALLARVEAAERSWLVDTSGSFTDANNQETSALDVVEYRFGARRGILLNVAHDGEADVWFRDTKKVENVKWHHLCKVPEPNNALDFPN